MKATSNQLSYLASLLNSCFSKRINPGANYARPDQMTIEECSRAIESVKSRLQGTFQAPAGKEWPNSETPAQRKRSGLCIRIEGNRYCNADQHNDRALCKPHADQHDSAE